MGFCVNGSDCYDAFLSYASVDDVVHGGWVGDFERYLKKMVVAELKRADQVANADAEMFSVCRDKTGFPEGGDLHEVIDEKVRQSQFLFIFLGKGYLKSGYCLSELDIFREKAGGTAEQALKRTYVIVLDRDALKSLQERQPEGMPDSRRPLWNKLSEFTQKGIRKEDFLLEDGLLPVYEREDRPDGEFHKRCTSLVQKFTKKLIDHRNTLRPQPPSLLIRPTVKALAIGAVPERLKMARDQLVGALAGVPVAVVEDDIRKPTDEIRERLKHAQVLVQPFDDFEVLYERRDPPGGHLLF